MENIRTIIATEHDGTDTRTLVINIRILDGDPQSFDVKDAVTKAVHEYLCTEEGKEVYDHNCEGFNWADFESNVPNEICHRHGFEKVESTTSDLEVDWDEHLADDGALNEFWSKEDDE